jgi:hypothetical protein
MARDVAHGHGGRRGSSEIRRLRRSSRSGKRWGRPRGSPTTNLLPELGSGRLRRWRAVAAAARSSAPARSWPEQARGLRGWL